MKNAVVTGGTGFIGGRLVDHLLSNGYKAKCLARKTSNTSSLVSLGADIVTGDLGDLESLGRLPEGGDVLFHLAALVTDWGPRDEFFRYNVDATRTLLDASIEAGVKRFVHMSSSTVVWRSDFNDVHNLVDIDETHPYPTSYNDNYNASKAEAEKLVLAYNNKGIETVVVRPSNVWGAGDTVILPRMARAAVKGVLHPMGKGSGTVSPCHVDNLARALILCAEIEQAPGNIYFINDGITSTFIDFTKKQLDAAGIQWEPGFRIPYKVGYAAAAILEALYRAFGSKKPPVLTRMAVAVLAGSRSYSIAKAKDELGYEPDTDIDRGMREIREWVAKIGGIDALLEYAK